MTPGWQRKIVGLDALLQRVAEARASGHKIVHCHGCFDIVHPGHIRYLEFARQQGDLLIVSLTGDSEIDKGELRPYIPQELRAENLAALMFVDLVHIHPGPTAEGLLAKVQPDLYVKGAEYAHRPFPERTVVEGYGGRVILAELEAGHSTTDLLAEILRRFGNDPGGTIL